mgnify:CR=1 FL=1
MKLSAHFSGHELACKGTSCCGGTCAVDIRLVMALEDFRAALGGRPFSPSSAFRCLVHNRAVGSDDTSQHPRGLAADIRLADFPRTRLEEMAAAARRIPEVMGLGIYDWGIHLDVRRGTYHRVEWDHRGR